MKYLFFVSTLYAMLCTGYDGRAQDAMSVWTTTPITTDGRSYEWPSFFRFYISGAKCQFDFYNDSTNLYLCIKASDVGAQSRLMHSGVNIWFDPLGKKKQKEGIGFPMKIDGAPGDFQRHQRADSDPSSAPSDRSRASKLRESVLFAQTTIKVTGMIDVKEPLLPLQNKYGIDIAYDWDSLGIMTIEYKIPLSVILQHPVTGADLQKPLGLGIVVGAEESTHTGSNQMSGSQGAQKGMNGPMAGSQGGGGGGRGGGGKGGGLQNNLANDRFNMDTEQQKVWLKVHLESKAAAQ